MFRATTISLEPGDVPNTLKIGYTGRKFEVQPCERVSLNGTYWSGGSKNTYTAVDMDTGHAVPFNAVGNDSPVEFGGTLEGKAVDLVPGKAVIRHSTFQGKDLGLTIYIHPDNAAKLLPAPVDISDTEATVLAIIKGYKPFYRREAAGKFGIDAEQWTATVEVLTARKFTRKNGAITPAGKNAISGHKAEGVNY